MATHETTTGIYNEGTTDSLEIEYYYTPGYAQTFEEPGEPEEFEFVKIIAINNNGVALEIAADKHERMVKKFEEVWIAEIKQDKIDSRNP